jgi:hypothetical protein
MSWKLNFSEAIRVYLQICFESLTEQSVFLVKSLLELEIEEQLKQFYKFKRIA